MGKRDSIAVQKVGNFLVLFLFISSRPVLQKSWHPPLWASLHASLRREETTVQP